MVDEVYPRLSGDVAIRRSGTDGLLIQHLRYRSQLPVASSHEPVLRALDGTHSLEALEAKLPDGPGRLPYRELSLLLFQLWDRGLLENGEEVRAVLFPHHTERTLDRETRWRGLRSLLGSSLMGPRISRIIVGRGVLAVQGLLGILAIAGLVSGQLVWPDNLFRLNGDWLVGFLLFYFTCSALLSVRGVTRGTILAAEGSGLRQMGLRHSVGVAYFDVDDREIYHLDSDLQLRFSLAGLLQAPAVAGFLVVTGLVASSSWAGNVAAIALVVGFLNLCPFFATDGARLIERFSGVSRQRFRVRSFISKELVRGLVAKAPTSVDAGWRFSAVATLWFLWFFGAVKLAVRLLVDHLTVLQSVVLAAEDSTTAVVAGLLLAYGLTLVLMILLVLLVVSVDLVRQLFQKRHADAPDGTQGVSSLSDGERRRLIDSIRQLTTHDSIPSETLDDVMSGVVQKSFNAGSWILRSGSVEPTYYWVISGRVELRQPLPEGGDLLVASLGAGESFGSGLSVDGSAQFDVRSVEDSTILALDTATLRQAVEDGGEEASGVRALLERLRFLGEVPVLASLGPSGRLDLASQAEDLTVEADQELIRQGGEADALYLVRSGRVRVERQDENGVTSQLAELGSGATFGEMGLLFKRSRTATVTSVEVTQLVKVSREVIDEVMKRSFHVGLALEGLATEREENLQ